MDWKNFDSNYFESVSKWAINNKPGLYRFDTLTKDVEKIKLHLFWYNICRPIGFNKISFTSDSVEIISDTDGNN